MDTLVVQGILQSYGVIATNHINQYKGKDPY